MKKRASLWISGITTVAMLTAAVGTFAAWDKLTPPATNFTATAAGTGTELTVTSDGFDTGRKLVPIGAIKGDGEVDSITATFTPTITANKVDKVKITLVKVPEVLLDGTVDLSVLSTQVYKTDDVDKSPVTVGTALESGTSYTVAIQYAANSASIADATTAGKSIAASVQCQAVALP